MSIGMQGNGSGNGPFAAGLALAALGPIIVGSLLVLVRDQTVSATLGVRPLPAETP